MLEVAPISETWMSYAEALMYCAFCTHNEHRDWQMATHDEWVESNEISGWFVDYEMHQFGVWNVTPVRDI